MRKEKKPAAQYAHVEGTPPSPEATWTSSASVAFTRSLTERFLGWRKVLCVVVLAGIGVGMEVFAKGGLSANMLELLKWLGISYLGANALKGGLEGLKQ